MKKTFFLFLISIFALFNATHARTFKGGWYDFDPYQYVEKYRETGLDVEIGRAIMKKTGNPVKFDNINWSDHVKGIENGTIDIAMNATKTKERQEFAYFSKPYRTEVNSFFLKKGLAAQHGLSTDLDQLLKTLKEQKLKFGVVKGYIYADKRINDFINDPANEDQIVFSANDLENIYLTTDQRIEGFFADRLAASTLIWKTKNRNELEELFINVFVPIHFMFSKKTVTPAFMEDFNKELEIFVKSSEASKIIRHYITPVLLMQTIDQTWFRVIDVIGHIAFALSGVIIAYRERPTITGAFVFAALPSVGGGTLRDILVNRDPVTILSTPVYLAIITSAVLLFFIMERLFPKRFISLFNTKSSTTTLQVADSLGQAAVTLSGVIIAVVVRIEPLWLWGPFFATLTGTGGGVMRDLLTKDKNVLIFQSSFRPEVSFFWGFVASLLLYFGQNRADPNYIFWVVIITLIGCFFTRLYAIYNPFGPVMFVHPEEGEHNELKH